MIYGGVVLVGLIYLDDEELDNFTDTALGKKYGWLIDAPNVQTRRDDWAGHTVIRAKVPVITGLR